MAVPTVLGIASIRVYTVNEAPAEGLVSREKVQLSSISMYHGRFSFTLLLYLILILLFVSSLTSTHHWESLLRLNLFQRVQELLREG